MRKDTLPITSFLKDVMRRKRCVAYQMAVDIGVSHAAVSRWLSGRDIPNTRSCLKLAEFSGIPLEKVLAAAGHMPKVVEKVATEWPEFREYARQKYSAELDEDMITMIEDLIERRRNKGRVKRNS
ncbi:helix-turn-helix domain-containing protein [Chloroflexota bacterium]